MIEIVMHSEIVRGFWNLLNISKAVQDYPCSHKVGTSAQVLAEVCSSSRALQLAAAG